MSNELEPTDEILIGYRGFNLTFEDNRITLRGSHGQAWKGPALEAVCTLNNNSAEEAVQHLKGNTCHCGIYSYTTIDKVQVGPPPTQEVERYKQGATVTIQTKDGRTFTSTVFAPKGAGVLGIEWADVDAKYRSLVPQAQVSGQQVESSLRVIHDFAGVKHVSELTDLIRAS